MTSSEGRGSSRSQRRSPRHGARTGRAKLRSRVHAPQDRNGVAVGRMPPDSPARHWISSPESDRIDRPEIVDNTRGGCRRGIQPVVSDW